MLASLLMTFAAQNGLSNDLRKVFESEALPLLDAMYPGAFALTRNKADADDLIQETCLKAFRAFGSFKPGTNLKAWLNRIMMNAYISGYRRKRRSPERANFDDVSEFIGDEQNGDANPEAWVELAGNMSIAAFADGLEEKLKAAIEALPDDFRAVLLLNTVNDLSYKEISEALDVPLGTVMSRLSRAKALVRDRLQAAVPSEDNHENIL